MHPLSRRGFLLGSSACLAIGRAQDTTFSTDVRVVTLFATVRNKQGQIIKDLNQQDFALEEDGKPQTIRYFSRESNLPLTLGLLVDTSLSQRRVLEQERTASYRFLQQVLREDKDQGFVIHFDQEVELLQDLTSSRKQLEAALDKLETPTLRRAMGGGGGQRGGMGQGRQVGTALYDSVLLAADEITKKQQGRKALILLTDGVDMGSKVSLMSAIESAQRADTLVYCILFADEEAYAGGRGGGGGNRGGWGGNGGGMGIPGLGGGRMGGGGMGRRGGMGGGGGRPTMREHPDGKKVLEQMARETGAGFFAVSKKEPIEKVFGQIEEELRNQYSLGYSPERKGSGFRKIQLTAQQRNLTVQTRDGYYAQ